MAKKHIHNWIASYYEIVYVGDGKNVNYKLSSVYCAECEETKEVSC